MCVVAREKKDLARKYKFFERGSFKAAFPNIYLGPAPSRSLGLYSSKIKPLETLRFFDSSSSPEELEASAR